MSLRRALSALFCREEPLNTERQNAAQGYPAGLRLGCGLPRSAERNPLALAFSLSRPWLPISPEGWLIPLWVLGSPLEGGTPEDRLFQHVLPPVADPHALKHFWEMPERPVLPVETCLCALCLSQRDRVRLHVHRALLRAELQPSLAQG